MSETRQHAVPVVALASARDFESRSFRFSYEAVGIVLDFVADTKPFTRFGCAVLVNAIKDQLRTGHNLYAYRGTKLLGYVGWLLTSEAIGRHWVETQTGLRPVPDDVADAAALTIVRADERQVLRALIRTARRLNPGKQVFFLREYADARSGRRRSVINRG